MKCLNPQRKGTVLSVAPCAGAWIEIIEGGQRGHGVPGRPLRGGVD